MAGLPHEPGQGLTEIERERMILRQGIDRESRSVRPSGIASMVIGLILLLMIGGIAFYTVPIMLADGEAVDGTRARYVEAYERITGASFTRYLEEDAIAP